MTIIIKVLDLIQYFHFCYDYTTFTSMEVLSFPAFSKQLRTDGSILEPPKAATSPSWRGTWMQSCKSSPNLRWSTNRFGSAISRNKSINKTISVVNELQKKGHSNDKYFQIRNLLSDLNGLSSQILHTHHTHIYIFLLDVLCRVRLVQLWKTKHEFVPYVGWKETR